jgi:50S ribosomal subunit-associated GTPase HflX
MRDNSQIPNIVICGNKCDLDSAITEDQLKGVKDKYNSPLFLCSAVGGNNVDLLFQYIGEIVDKTDFVENQVSIPNVAFVSTVNQNNHTKKCC